MSRVHSFIQKEKINYYLETSKLDNILSSRKKFNQKIQSYKKSSDANVMKNLLADSEYKVLYNLSHQILNNSTNLQDQNKVSAISGLVSYIAYQQKSKDKVTVLKKILKVVVLYLRKMKKFDPYDFIIEILKNFSFSMDNISLILLASLSK